MYKKHLLILISLLVVLSLVLGVVACSSPGSSPTTSAPATSAAPAAPVTSAAPAPATSAPAPATSAAPAPATSQAPATSTASSNAIILSMAPINCGPPPAGGTTQVLNEMANLMQTKSGGKIKINIYWAQSLSPVNQIVNNTSTGVCDIGAVAPAQEPGKLPLSMVSQLPGFGTDYWAQCMAFWDLMNQEPLLSEYTKYNLLPLSVNFVPDYHLISVKPINTVADLKGKKISAAGLMAQTLQSLGAVPVAMSPNEQYEGMQKGTIDANVAPYSAISDFKFYEVAKNIEDFPLGGRLQPVLINKNSWNKLPPDVQTAIKGLVPDVIKINTNTFFVKDQPLYPLNAQIIQDNKLQLIHIGDADVATIAKVQSGQADTWAADQDKNGNPGTKILGDYRTLVDKYSKMAH